MAKKKNTIPSGFEDVLGSIYSNVEEHESVTDMNTLDSTIEIPLDDEDKTEEPPVDKTEDGKTTDDTQDASHEDNSEIPEDIINNKQVDNNAQTTEVDNTEETEDDTEPSDADVIEAQQVGLLFDAIGQQLGWNMADIDEKDRPLTVKELTEYWVDTIQ